MKLTIRHRTEYQYQHQVAHSTQYLRLTPKSSARQKILRWELSMPEHATRSTDAFGNVLHVLTIDQPHDHICIEAFGEVELSDDPIEDDDARLSPMVYQRFTPITHANSDIRTFAQQYGATPSLASLAKMSAAILAQIPYNPGATTVTSTASEAFAGGSGVCQDHAHVFLSWCRVLGLAARYVSGYLCTSDSSHVASHAWAEVWLDGIWHTFDVTNQENAPDNHLKLAVGLDYLDACPVRGVRYGGGQEDMHAFALVERDDTLANQ